MLVLTRFDRQTIWIGDNIVLRILAVRGKKIRLGIEAPDEVSIAREEKSQRPSSQNVSPSLGATHDEK